MLYNKCHVLYFTEDDLRNIGPVDAQVYLEEMSWNEGWNFFFLLTTLKKLGIFYKKKRTHWTFGNLKKK